MLDDAAIVRELLGRGLIGAADIVDGDLTVESVSRRNRNVIVRRSSGPSYLVKHAVGPDRRATLAAEARVYDLLQSQAPPALAPHLCRSMGYDDEAGLLILEFVDRGHDLRAHHARRARFSSGLAGQLGAALAGLHAWQPPAAALVRLPFRPPWGLSLHRLDLAGYREASAANLRLIEIIQRSSECCERLDALRAAWRATSLIHRDLKWDNVLVAPGALGVRPPATSLRLIDWELAGRGDPVWDAGAVIGEYLSFWVLSMPVSTAIPPEQAQRMARFPLERMRPALSAFWDAYVAGLYLDAAAAGAALERALQYSAAWMLQVAIERTQTETELPGALIVLVQLSVNILLRPAEAAAQLVQLASEGRVAA